MIGLGVLSAGFPRSPRLVAPQGDPGGFQHRDPVADVFAGLGDAAAGADERVEVGVALVAGPAVDGAAFVVCCHVDHSAACETACC